MANTTLRPWNIDSLHFEWLEHLAQHDTFVECRADSDIEWQA
jgi:hypothetical protein